MKVDEKGYKPQRVAKKDKYKDVQSSGPYGLEEVFMRKIKKDIKHNVLPRKINTKKQNIPQFRQILKEKRREKRSPKHSLSINEK